MKAQGLLTLAYVAAVLAYAAADRDGYVSPLVLNSLIDDRVGDRRAGFILAESSTTLLRYTHIFPT